MNSKKKREVLIALLSSSESFLYSVIEPNEIVDIARRRLEKKKKNEINELYEIWKTDRWFQNAIEEAV